jgi:hypothetical protein
MTSAICKGNTCLILAMFLLAIAVPTTSFNRCGPRIQLFVITIQNRRHCCIIQPLFGVIPTSTSTEIPLIPATHLYRNNLSYLESKKETDAGMIIRNNSVTRTSTRDFDKGIIFSSTQQLLRYITDVLGLALLSLLLSMLLISWEDLTCKNVLPNRHRTSISLYQPSTHWGESTVRGMGFGQRERELLFNAEAESKSFESDPLLNAPTYNEVMLNHRSITIPNWKRIPTQSMASNAIHTIIESIQQLNVLREMANEYQWDSIRNKLHDTPISDLPVQSSLLRQVSPDMNEVVGFDWGSCAWRHCGAISDIQEAIDEMDQLLGVLEPYEINFCMDIIERSLRDILSVVPWQQYASKDDILVYKSLPPYVSPAANSNSMANVDDDDDSILSRIDSAYFKALQELRID